MCLKWNAEMSKVLSLTHLRERERNFFPKEFAVSVKFMGTEPGSEGPWAEV